MADDIDNVTATAPLQIIYQEGQLITSAVTLTLVRDTTDDYMFPTKGTKANISITEAGGPLQGDANYTQYGASLFAYYPLPLRCCFWSKGPDGLYSKPQWRRKCSHFH